MQLKKGDLVKCVRPKGSYLTRNKEYTVTGLWGKDGYSFQIKDDDKDFIPCIYPSCAHGDWELVTNDK